MTFEKLIERLLEACPEFDAVARIGILARQPGLPALVGWRLTPHGVPCYAPFAELSDAEKGEALLARILSEVQAEIACLTPHGLAARRITPEGVRLGDWVEYSDASAGVCPALVCLVREDKSLNLTVFGEGGPNPRFGVPYAGSGVSSGSKAAHGKWALRESLPCP